MSCTGCRQGTSISTREGKSSRVVPWIFNEVDLDDRLGRIEACLNCPQAGPVLCHRAGEVIVLRVRDAEKTCPDDRWPLYQP